MIAKIQCALYKVYGVGFPMGLEAIKGRGGGGVAGIFLTFFFFLFFVLFSNPNE